MNELKPIAWMFDWVSSEVDKPYTSISLSYPVDEHEVFVSNIRPLYEKPFPQSLTILNLKEQIDELVEVLEGASEVIDYIDEWNVPIRLSTRIKEVIAKAKGE